MYKQVLSASVVGDVLQHKWEVRNREDPHVVAVMEDSLLWPCSTHHLQKCRVFIFVNLHSFGKFAKVTSHENLYIYGSILRKKALTFVLSSLLFTATVLEGLFGEYHSSSAALGQQRPEVTKQPLVCDWLAIGRVVWSIVAMYCTLDHIII